MKFIRQREHPPRNAVRLSVPFYIKCAIFISCSISKKYPENCNYITKFKNVSIRYAGHRMLLNVNFTLNTTESSNLYKKLMLN